MAAVKLDVQRSSYHDYGPGSWRDAPHQGNVVGIELEIEGDGAWEEVVGAMPPHDEEIDGPRPHFEHDASLSSRSGVEVIFPPYPLASLRNDPGNYFIKAVTSLQAVDMSSSRCGLHLNVNTSDWGRPRASVFMAVVHFLPREALERLGGRRLNSYCDQFKAAETLRWLERHPYDDHSYAAEHKGDYNRIELRFPASTTSLWRLQILFQFIESAQEFSQTYSNMYAHPQTVAEDYVDWLLTHRQEEYDAVAEILQGTEITQ